MAGDFPPLSFIFFYTPRGCPGTAGAALLSLKTLHKYDPKAITNTDKNHFDIMGQSMGFQAPADFVLGGVFIGRVVWIIWVSWYQSTRTWLLGSRKILGGGWIGTVESVALAAWALDMWHGYAVQARINCVGRANGDIFLGGRGISAVGLFSGAWALDGRR